MSDNVAEKEATTREVLAAHFVMWHALPGGGPVGEWRCACGQKFGFSDTAIDHVTDQLADVGERLFSEGYEQAREDLAACAGREVVEYGVRPQQGAYAGDPVGPLNIDQIGRWNRQSMTAPPRLLIRTVVVHEPTEWREATGDEIDASTRSTTSSGPMSSSTSGTSSPPASQPRPSTGR